MIIKTRDFGEISFENESVVKFIEGLYGFEEYTDYLIVKHEPDDDLMFMQSVENENLSFVVTDPFILLPEYSPVLSKDELQSLEVFNVDELRFLVIAVIADDIKQSVVNLKNPIAINPETKRAKQLILSENNYPMRYKLFHTGDGGGSQCL